MPSEELKAQYWELHKYIIRRIVDYGAMVAEETDEYDPNKYGSIVAEIVKDIIQEAQEFALKVFKEEMAAAKADEEEDDEIITEFH
jgi:hypothetical protein